MGFIFYFGQGFVSDDDIYSYDKHTFPYGIFLGHMFEVCHVLLYSA